MAYAITESAEKTEGTEMLFITGLFLPQKAQNNGISAVLFIPCYTNCYSILRINALSRFVDPYGYNKPLLIQ